MTLARQSSSRSRSSSAPTLKNRRPREPAASAVRVRRPAGGREVAGDRALEVGIRPEQGINGRRQIGDDERNAARRQCRGRGRDIVLVIELHILEREALVEEFAGGVVVVDRELRAGDPVVLGRYVNERNACLRLRTAQVADLDLDWVGRGRGPREQDGPGQQKADHRSAPSDCRVRVDETVIVCLNHDNLRLCYWGYCECRMRRMDRRACRRR